MYIRKKHLSRRTLLQGAGAALGLPLLDAMLPAGTALEAAKELATTICANGPLAVKAILATLRETEMLSEEEAFAMCRRIAREEGVLVGISAGAAAHAAIAIAEAEGLLTDNPNHHL